MMLPESLDLRVTHGLVEGVDGSRSGQIDCMLVRGEGIQIPHTSGHIWMVKDVLAVFEVKKTLFRGELSDAHDQLSVVLDQFWDFLAEGRDSRFDITASRYVFGQIVGRPVPDELETLDYYLGMLYHSIVAEQISPIRVVFGYGGFANEFTLRKGFLKFIKDREAGPGLTASSLPSMVISGESSIVRFNGHPYYLQLRQGRFLLYASSSENPLLVLLNLLLTKISYLYGAPEWFSGDLTMERFAPLMWTRAVERDGDNEASWLYLPHQIRKKELVLLASEAQIEWEPLPITEFQFVIINSIGRHGLSRELYENLSLNEPDAERQIQELREHGLTGWSGDRLVFLTEECTTMITGDGAVAADGSDPRFTTWFLNKAYK